MDDREGNDPDGAEADGGEVGDEGDTMTAATDEETTAPDPDDVRREVERLGDSAASLREHAEELLDHLEKWDTGEVPEERRADSREELFARLDKWETSHDDEGDRTDRDEN